LTILFRIKAFSNDSIEENGGRGHAAPTPNELGKGQEEEVTKE
jgi:hypothetical protein